jgi:hypothetical protein
MTPEQKQVLDEQTAKEEQAARDAAIRKKTGRNRTNARTR